MCIKIVERYAVCKCVYHEHNVDPCKLVGWHAADERTVLVGYACPDHNNRETSMTPLKPSANASYDSGHQRGGKKK